MQLVAIKNDYLDLSDPGGYLGKTFGKQKTKKTMASSFSPFHARVMQKLIKATPNPRRRNSCPLLHTALQSSCWRLLIILVPKVL